MTLEISALQFFPWLIGEARQAIERRELMPGRYIRVRRMAEQVADKGDTLAVAAAMRIIGASHVETLDTKGTDGSNVHLGGPETITGYFGGVGQPNDYPMKWIDEYLGYYTRYGIRQVLNVNPGTVLAAYLLHRLGVDCEFKISVFVGNDNPWSVLWTLMTARLFSRPDGSSSLIGFNFSNSVNNETIRECDRIRAALGLTRQVRFEHHITETAKSIVRQPYLRRDELVELARTVPNISAKHEGGDPEVEATRAHPSDILDYFLSKEEIEAKGLMPAMLTNYLDKHESVNRTAAALLRAGIGVVPAPLLHGGHKRYGGYVLPAAAAKESTSGAGKSDLQGSPARVARVAALPRGALGPAGSAGQHRAGPGGGRPGYAAALPRVSRRRRRIGRAGSREGVPRLLRRARAGKAGSGGSEGSPRDAPTVRVGSAVEGTRSGGDGAAEDRPDRHGPAPEDGGRVGEGRPARAARRGGGPVRGGPEARPASAAHVLELLDGITASMIAAVDRSTDDFRALKKGMGYCWSVAVAALPREGKKRMERWLTSTDPDVAWVMKENMKKNRLAKMDPAWVRTWRP